MALANFRKLSNYTKHATTILFIVGFIFDIILLPDISERLAQYIGILYLFGIGSLIIFREWLVSRNTASTFEQRFYSLATFGIAYLSGSALSFVLVYTIRAAELSVSWPLLFLLLGCIFANEAVSSHKYRFTLDIAVLFIAMLFFIIFNLPVILKQQNDYVFLISSTVSIILGLAYVTMLKYSSEVAEYEAPRGYALALGIPMFVGMLYVLNILPAVPLSMSSSGVYHSVSKFDDGSYMAQIEDASSTFTLLNKITIFRKPTYHFMPTDKGVYVYASIKSPAEVTAPIVHVWEYYDTKTKKWVETSRIPYVSTGGRDNGYRAYTYKENVENGLWRVTIQVGRNRVIGRTEFYIVHTDTVIPLKNIFL